MGPGFLGHTCPVVAYSSTSTSEKNSDKEEKNGDYISENGDVSDDDLNPHPLVVTNCFQTKLTFTLLGIMASATWL